MLQKPRHAQYRESRKGRAFPWRCVTPVGFRGPCRWPAHPGPTLPLALGIVSAGVAPASVLCGDSEGQGWGHAVGALGLDFGGSNKGMAIICVSIHSEWCVCVRTRAHVGVLLMALVSSCCIFFFFFLNDRSLCLKICCNSCHFIIKWHFLLFRGTPVKYTLGLNYWEHSSRRNLFTKKLLKSSMRLVFSHVQYHVELCLQGMLLPLITGSRGRGGGGKNNSVSSAALPSQSRRGRWLGIEFVTISWGLGLPGVLRSSLEPSGGSPRHPFWQCRKTSSELMRWGRLQAGRK